MFLCKSKPRVVEGVVVLLHAPVSTTAKIQASMPGRPLLLESQSFDGATSLFETASHLAAMGNTVLVPSNMELLRSAAKHSFPGKIISALAYTPLLKSVKGASDAQSALDVASLYVEQVKHESGHTHLETVPGHAIHQALRVLAEKTGQNPEHALKMSGLATSLAPMLIHPKSSAKVFTKVPYDVTLTGAEDKMGPALVKAISNVVQAGSQSVLHGSNYDAIDILETIEQQSGLKQIAQWVTKLAGYIFYGVDIGDSVMKGWAFFDSKSKSLIMNASGRDVNGNNDSCHFECLYVEDNWVLTAAVNYIKSSSKSYATPAEAKAGLMFRLGYKNAAAATIYLYVTARNGVCVVVRSSNNASIPAGNKFWLVQPQAKVTTLTKIWLRLERNGSEFTASYSYNNKVWAAGKTVSVPQFPLAGYLGFCQASAARNQEGTFMLVESSWTDINLDLKLIGNKFCKAGGDVHYWIFGSHQNWQDRKDFHDVGDYLIFGSAGWRVEGRTYECRPSIGASCFEWLRVVSPKKNTLQVGSNGKIWQNCTLTTSPSGFDGAQVVYQSPSIYITIPEIDTTIEIQVWPTWYCNGAMDIYIKAPKALQDIDGICGNNWTKITATGVCSGTAPAKPCTCPAPDRVCIGAKLDFAQKCCKCSSGNMSQSEFDACVFDHCKLNSCGEPLTCLPPAQVDRSFCCRGQEGAVDGGWSSWQDVGTCSKVCGTGKQLQKRFCNNPSPCNFGKPCQGSDTQERPCNTDPCRRDCAVIAAELRAQGITPQTGEYTLRSDGGVTYQALCQFDPDWPPFPTEYPKDCPVPK
eukprot:TRINITY_DN1006_c0_g1_i1.p1 TRINITY_DN1006_c0_g1~~TRINITY_DN1006_c0_g1_i1.p1  ORF type:complete len:814 (-),score=114.08 TRINITY_DN1006_c0_g1_i1:118-2538(-)